jgi:hypothetical protein
LRVVTSCDRAVICAESRTATRAGDRPSQALRRDP